MRHTNSLPRRAAALFLAVLLLIPPVYATAGERKLQTSTQIVNGLTYRNTVTVNDGSRVESFALERAANSPVEVIFLQSAGTTNGAATINKAVTRAQEMGYQVLGGINSDFFSPYGVPLGIAVAIEFTGPLAVAAFTSRSRRELLWVGLAVAGVAPLLPLGAFSADLDPVGVGFGFCAGFFWALYMIFGKKAGMVRGTDSVALGTAVAAMIALPVGLLCEGTALFSPAVLPSGLLVGIFSSALPYGLEMLAMTRLSTQTYGVLTSLEPAMAALSGFVFLGETLTLVQWGALACVMGASLGATLTGRRE